MKRHALGIGKPRHPFFEMKNLVLVLMALAIIVLLGIMLVPKVTTSYIERGFVAGYQRCQVDTVNKVIQDVNSVGYTAVTVGNQSMILAPAVPAPAQGG